MNWLISADIHLSDRPRDDHRFGLFKWLAKQQKQHDVDATFILGDITQEKDNHSSALVNRMIDELTGLRPPILIVRGNHDGIDPNNPFFRFLNNIGGVGFFVEPAYAHGRDLGIIPHCKTQAELLAACTYLKPRGCRYFMCHQTFEGAIAETGKRLSGLSAAPIEAMKPAGVWAGDVHRPQTLGCVTYVGAPYAVRFGDDFTPRVLLIKDGKSHDLHFPARRKLSLTIRSSDDLGRGVVLDQGDQVKITVELPREKVVDWLKHKRMILDVAKELGVEVYGIELKVENTALPKMGKGAPKLNNTELLGAFCKAEKVPSAIREAGLAIIGTDNANTVAK